VPLRAVVCSRVPVIRHGADTPAHFESCWHRAPTSFISIRRHCMRANQSDSQKLVTLGFLGKQELSPCNTSLQIQVKSWVPVIHKDRRKKSDVALRAPTCGFLQFVSSDLSICTCHIVTVLPFSCQCMLECSFSLALDLECVCDSV